MRSEWMACLLASALGLASLSAQDEGQQAGQQAGKETGQQGAPGRGPPGSETGDGEVTTAFPAPLGAAFDVRVHQDPVRIGPGETGTVILHVVLPVPGTRVTQSGRVQMQDLGGPLAFGTAKWRPPPGGKSHYEDSFVISVPVTVKADASHNKYTVTGSLELNGTFPAAGANPGAPRTGRQSATFTGNVTVGPPMPKVSAVRRRTKPAPETGDESQEEQPAGRSAGGRRTPDGPPSESDALATPGPEVAPSVRGSETSTESARGFLERNLALVLGGVLVVVVGLVVLVRRGRG